MSHPVPLRIEDYQRKGGLKVNWILKGPLGYKRPSLSAPFLVCRKGFDLLDFQGYPKSRLIRKVGSEGMQKLRKSRQETVVHGILVPP